MMKNLLSYSLLLVSVGSMGLAFEPEMVTKDLVGFWSFDQTTIRGKTVNDIWSKNHGLSRKVSKVNLVKPCRLTEKGSGGNPTSCQLRPQKKRSPLNSGFLLKGQNGDNEYPRPTG